MKLPFNSNAVNWFASLLRLEWDMQNGNFAYHLMCLLNMGLTPREIWIVNVLEQKKYHVSGCGENENGEFINLLLNMYLKQGNHNWLVMKNHCENLNQHKFMLSANVLRLSNILFHYIHHFPVRYYFLQEMILVTKMCCLWKLHIERHNHHR